MMHVIHLLLAGAGVLAAYCLLALASPTRKCWRCRHTPRRSKRWLGLFGPTGKCRRCNGKLRHPRRGAGLVHRFAWLVIDAIRERRQERPEGTEG